ncbi:MAG: KTSC domain-containing protein [Saprospiraceae bacterium]
MVILNRLFVLIIIVFVSCKNNSCEIEHKRFNTYENAVLIVRNSQFEYYDFITTNKSTWIDKAEYYSCDKKIGYLIIEVDSRTYIHKDLPYQIWNDFKTANSFGAFYNKIIKGKFSLILE